VAAMPSLPEDLEAELAAFDQLTDDALWLLAKSTMCVEQREEIAMLNDAAQRRDLSLEEIERQDALLDVYYRVIVRRAQAAAILKVRGHDVQVLISK
jgi:hypothetical protein